MQSKNQARTAIIAADPLSSFRCGCGAEYFSSEQFKTHSLRIHSAQFIKNSTHFLSTLTEVVLPVHENLPTQNGCEKQQSLKQPKEYKCQGFGDHGRRSPINRQKKVNNRKAQQTSAKQEQKLIQQSRTPTKEKKRLKISNIPQSVASHPTETESQIEWNGFKLIKNKLCPHQPYYCGACKNTFSHPEEFTIHCIEQCKTLRNLKSSHLISCDFDQISMRQRMGIQDQSLNKSSSRAIRQESKMPDKTASTNEMNLSITGPIKEIYKKHLDHRNGPFFCGFCNKEFKSCPSYYMHITQGHSQLISPSSSHVVLRISRNFNTEVGLLFISPTVEWIHNDPIYCCPCKPQRKMPMSSLTNHVMEVHKGISPIYDIYNSRQRFITSRIITPQIITPRTFNPIQAFVKNKLAEKIQGPFICFTCNKTFEMRGYKRHLQWHLRQQSQQKHLQLSHVVLIANIGDNNRRCCYISPSEEWENEDAVYYCPCEPKRKVTMSELLQHHIQVHKYSSPLYQFDDSNELQ